MEYAEAALLGVLQGITEFLPISSSGHLVLAQELTGVELGAGITFEVVVHFGSLFSILIYFRKRILAMLREPRMIGLILLSMIPAGVVGLLFKDTIEAWFQNPLFVSGALLVTGTLLHSTRYAPEPRGPVTPASAIAIGLAQAFAILPGISRSGTTITVGSWLGIRREDLAEFSFIMVLPVIAGVTLLDLKDAVEAGIDPTLANVYLVGFLASFASGYLALKTLIHIFKRKGLHPFSWYCWIVGAGSMAWFALR